VDGDVAAWDAQGRMAMVLRRGAEEEVGTVVVAVAVEMETTIQRGLVHRKGAWAKLQPWRVQVCCAL